MDGAPDAAGTVRVALEHAARLLQRDPSLALEQCAEILKAAPNHPAATLMQGVAHRLSGDAATAVQVLTRLTDAQHRWAQAHHERGLALMDAGCLSEAIAAVRQAIDLKADLPDAHRTLGDLLTAVGDSAAADRAYAAHIRASTRDPRLLAPANALVENRIPEAEGLLRAHLKQHPTDVAALRMLAEVAARLGRLEDARILLERCLELAPGFHPARYNLALVLHRLDRPADALGQIDHLLAADPRHPAYRNLRAVALVKVGEYREAISLYSQILANSPDHAAIWMSLAHAQSTEGQVREAIAAYRRSIELAPGFGEAYWSLANLKTFRFDASEVDAMRVQLARGDLRHEDRFHFHFALGKALEDAGEYAESFEHYSQGNRLRRQSIRYDAADTSARVDRTRQVCTAAFFRERSGHGCEAGDPIFIVGLPRAGSTLVEQILASHSKVEGTMELPNLVGIARELNGRKRPADPSRYPEILREFAAQQCRQLGERYLDETRIQRKTGRPHFIDKLPNNFMHIGLIQLILPNARIIDARRHPMACCFSAFKQHFAMGQHYTYSLAELGHYYRSYVDLMAHFDAVLPGRIHRVIYEDLIGDTETQVRALLAHCGLSFEEACLHFHRNERAVRTASAHQVRQPIFREGIDHWRHFEPWLDPLVHALGPEGVPSVDQGRFRN